MSRGNVILVPGFLGNEMYHRSFGGSLQMLWLSLSAMVATGFERLALPTDDRPGLPPDGTDIVVGPSLDGPYREVRQYLQLREWEVHDAGLDWRQPIAHSAAILRDRIIRLGEERPCHIIAHSRGGLVTRAALGLLTADQRPAFVGRVIGCGVPHVGSLQAVATLGDCSDFLRNIKRAVGLSRPFTNPFASSKRVDDCLRSWPALYELLPDPGRSLLSQASIDAIYRPSTYLDDGVETYPAHLGAAQARWAQIPNIFPSVEWVDVIGLGIETIAGLALPLDLTHRRGYVLGDGDGTVASGSAGYFGRVKITCPCAHDALLRDGRVLPLIHKALLAYPAFDVQLGGRVAF